VEADWSAVGSQVTLICRLPINPFEIEASWIGRFTMDRFFSEIGISAVDFVYIWAVFVTTMAAFFGLQKKHVWLSYVITGIFILICLSIIFFRPGLNVRLFAALMIVSVITVEVAVTLIRKRSASKYT
jgi:hypothetical protein